MSQFANCVRALIGEPLRTLTYDRPFAIVSVEGDVVRIKNSKNKGRAISLSRIEEVAGLGLQRDEYRQRTHRLFPESRNTSYIAAIAHAAVTRNKVP
jgi:hypothetical protein